MKGRGVIPDVVSTKVLGRLPPPSYGIGADDLAAAAESQSVTVQAGDVVLIRTGRYQEGPDASAFLTDELRLNPDHAKWLVEQGAMLVGSDNIALEQLPSTDESTWCPVHMYPFNEAGLTIIEVVNCEELEAAKATNLLLPAFR